MIGIVSHNRITRTQCEGLLNARTINSKDNSPHFYSHRASGFAIVIGEGLSNFINITMISVLALKDPRLSFEKSRALWCGCAIPALNNSGH